jgi:hypothetical protein
MPDAGSPSQRSSSERSPRRSSQEPSTPDGDTSRPSPAQQSREHGVGAESLPDGPSRAGGDVEEAAQDLRRAFDDTDKVHARLEWFAKWSDDIFRIPGTTYRVGLEPLVGLIPGVGDAAGLVVSAYVPVEAWRQGAPWALIGTMLLTIAVDALAGTVPVLGDVFDVTYRANRRNANRLIEWMEEEGEEL